MNINESIIRDKLSNFLHILEPGLELISIEKYLPNSKGTRGFIDILATDATGRYVLIELKRSNSTSREAIHEILKYVEGCKINLAVKEDEIRVFIVSTEWDELLVPFSSFSKKTSLSVTGFKLIIDDVGTPLLAQKIDPLSLTEDRIFTPWHEVNLYTSSDSLTKGITSYEEMCKENKINDYTLIILSAHPEFRAKELSSIQETLKSMNLPMESLEQLDSKIQKHTHMLYFSTLKLDELTCLDLLKEKLDEDQSEEFFTYLVGLDEKARQCAIQEAILELEPRPHSDYMEIGYPAKFIKILDDENWNIEEILRYGAIKNNSILRDGTIIEEIRGNQGVTRQKYKKKLTDNTSKELSRISNEISRVLEDNPIWKNHLNIIIPQLEELGNENEITISIFNPSNIILSIYNFINRDDGVLYIPSYGIVFEDDHETQMIFGILESTGNKPSLTEIVSSYFDGYPQGLLSSLNWGGYERRDAKIVRDIGLTYSSYKLARNTTSETYWKFTELGWEKCTPLSMHEKFFAYLNENQDFIEDIDNYFSSHWNGFMTSFNNNEVVEFKT